MKSIWIISILLIIVINMTIASQIPELKERLKREPDNVELLVNLGKAYHHKGVDGDKEAVKEAEKILKKALKLSPDNAEALAWYGSVLTLKGRDAWFPISKLRYVHQGIRKIDRAIELAPDNITVRMVRAINSLGLPEFFNRLEFAITDLEYLLKLRKEIPESFPAKLLPSIYLNLGKAYRKKKESKKAEECLNKVLELAPESKEAKEAKEILSKIN